MTQGYRSIWSSFPQLQSLGWSGFWLSGLWLGGWAMPTTLAQTLAPTTMADEMTGDLVVPSAQELLSSPESSFETPELPSEPSAEFLDPLPASDGFAPLELESNAPQPTPSLDSEFSSPSANDPSGLTGTGTGTSADTLGSSADQLEGTPLVAPNLIDQSTTVFGGQSSFGQASFGQSGAGIIDSTAAYSLGATDNPNVVLTERSTGCETVVQPGQGIPNSLCSFVGLGDAPYTNSDGGSISLGSFGDMNLSVVYSGGRTTPSAQDYYNLTVRPPARLSVGNVNLLFPLSIPAAITSAFGWRVHPVMGESRFHSGTDLGAPLGTPVLAAFSGQVTVADFMGGYGLTVVVKHEKGTEESLYAHLSEIFVKPGETVKQGEVLGRVGSTGMSTGPHLHFEFRKQTPSGWVVMDAGGALDFALSQFVTALRLGQPYPPKLAMIRSTSFTKALEMVQDELKAEAGQVDQPNELTNQLGEASGASRVSQPSEVSAATEGEIGEIN